MRLVILTGMLITRHVLALDGLRSTDAGHGHFVRPHDSSARTVQPHGPRHDCPHIQAQVFLKYNDTSRSQLPDDESLASASEWGPAVVPASGIDLSITPSQCLVTRVVSAGLGPTGREDHVVSS